METEVTVGDEDITFAFDTVFIVRRIDDRSRPTPDTENVLPITKEIV